MLPLRFRIFLAFALSSIPSLHAQQGDRPNEVQGGVPAEWKIPPAPILSPEEEAQTFQLPRGFRIELVAADPLVGDPVAAVFGPDGRLWVVEMRSYMPDIDGRGEDAPIGCVAVLEDTDADGRFDRRTVFLDGLILPRAVSLVGDGVLIAEPPHLWFARDIDGDGRADSKVEIASDYGGIGNPEHMANGLVWMMDNWIYSANHTTRYRYRGGDAFLADSTITRGQWGITQDDAGHLFYNSNSDPLRMDALPSAYLKRNTNLGSRAGTNIQIAPADLPTWPGRITPGVNRGYQNLRPDGTLTSVTAACSPVIYRGELFPDDFRGDAFICEPSANLVKRIRLTPGRDGIPAGTNAYARTDFLTSTDERFRPVSIYNGPDGALWIVDMYRGVIQHRTYVTTYLRKQVKQRSLEEGRGLGRIWRVVPDTVPTHASPVKLAGATPAELVARLQDGNGWVRDTAQRLLVERKHAAVAPELRRIVHAMDSPAPARLHALWTLDGLGVLDRDTVLIAMRDSDPRVVTAAVRLSERWLADPGDGGMFERVSALLRRDEIDASPDAVRQIALSLGEARSPEKLETLARIAARFGAMRFAPEAIVSGIAGAEETFIARLASREAQSKAIAPVIAVAAECVLRSNEGARLSALLTFATAGETPSWVRSAIFDGIEAFLPRRADGAVVNARLAVKPAPLIDFAHRVTSPEAARAQKILEHLEWPGRAGASPAVALTAAEQKRFEAGRATYASLCAACHQPAGQGLAGLAPALVNSRWALGSPEIAASIVLGGKSEGAAVMPSLRAVLDDEAIANVLTFVRRAWGHSASAVDRDLVAKTRAATAQRDQPFTEAELATLESATMPADSAPRSPAR